MNATTPHPAPGLLAAFGNGMLSEADTPAVAAHLETCASCRRIAAAPPPDSFIRLIQAARPANAGAVDPDVPPELADHPRYRIVRELGHGGMGVVYEAEHRLMDRRVALKVISKDLVDRPEVLARFHAEVKAAARLNHPNIVQPYDAEQAGDLHLLVMEYVEGTDLARLVRQQGPLPVGQACGGCARRRRACSTPTGRRWCIGTSSRRT